jgi:hypothetical protein
MATINDLKKRYHPDIVEHMLDVLYDTPVSDLIADLLHLTPLTDLDKWAQEIQEDNSYSDEVNND